MWVLGEGSLRKALLWLIWSTFPQVPKLSISHRKMAVFNQFPLVIDQESLQWLRFEEMLSECRFLWRNTVSFEVKLKKSPQIPNQNTSPKFPHLPSLAVNY